MGPLQKRILAYPLRNRLAFLSLGPNGTYYARGLEEAEHPWAGTWEGKKIFPEAESSPNYGEKRYPHPPTSYELPQSLMSDTGMAEILTKERPQVWLGRHGSWVVHWREDYSTLGPYWSDVKWHLNDVDLYPGLEKFLRTYKTVWKEIKEHGQGAHGQVLLMVSFYPLIRFTPTLGNALGRQRALAIEKHNNCLWIHRLTYFQNLALDNSSNNWAAMVKCPEKYYHFYYNCHSSKVFAELERQWNERFHADKDPQIENWRWIDVKDLRYHFLPHDTCASVTSEPCIRITT